MKPQQKTKRSGLILVIALLFVVSLAATMLQAPPLPPQEQTLVAVTTLVKVDLTATNVPTLAPAATQSAAWESYGFGMFLHYCTNGKPKYEWRQLINIYRMDVIALANLDYAKSPPEEEYKIFSIMGNDSMGKPAPSYFAIVKGQDGGYAVDNAAGNWGNSWLIANYPGGVQQFAKDFEPYAKDLHKKYADLKTFWLEKKSDICTPDMPTE